jgi:hypothetical protein
MAYALVQLATQTGSLAAQLHGTVADPLLLAALTAGEVQFIPVKVYVFVPAAVSLISELCVHAVEAVPSMFLQVRNNGATLFTHFAPGGAGNVGADAAHASLFILVKSRGVAVPMEAP